MITLKTEINQENILEINDLRTSFFVGKNEVKAVDGVTFQVPKGKTLGIVGESGSGKSITSLSILRLIDEPGKIVGGSINFKGEDLTKVSMSRMRQIRGNEISMIFQEPMTSLNPVYTIGQQLREAFKIHQGLGKKEGTKRAIEMLELVGIPSPDKRVNQYPFELSGGMRQRVMIAMALLCQPKLLIADEPTTALDVTVQAQIMGLLNELKQEFNTAIIMITHDLGVVASVCDKVLVMYAGHTMEYGTVQDIFYQPTHPYTLGLLQAIPSLDDAKEELHTIPGNPPNLLHLPKGCPFVPRCEFSIETCLSKPPILDQFGEQHLRACYRKVEELAV